MSLMPGATVTFVAAHPFCDASAWYSAGASWPVRYVKRRRLRPKKRGYSPSGIATSAVTPSAAKPLRSRDLMSRQHLDLNGGGAADSSLGSHFFVDDGAR